MDQQNTPGRKAGLRKPSAGDSAADASGESASSLATQAGDTGNLNGTSFEQAISELEGLVAKLEGSDLPLADALAAYQRGSALMRHAQGLLDQVQSQIEVIESGEVRSIDRAKLISQVKE